MELERNHDTHIEQQVQRTKQSATGGNKGNVMQGTRQAFNVTVSLEISWKKEHSGQAREDEQASDKGYCMKITNIPFPRPDFPSLKFYFFKTKQNASGVRDGIVG